MHEDENRWHAGRATIICISESVGSLSTLRVNHPRDELVLDVAIFGTVVIFFFFFFFCGWNLCGE